MFATGYIGSTATRQLSVNRSMWTTASGRLPVIQLEIFELAHLEWLLFPTAVVQLNYRRPSPNGRGCVKTLKSSLRGGEADEAIRRSRPERSERIS